MAFNTETFALAIQNPLEGTRFAVEKITDTFLGQDSKIYYKVRWQETWEPEERLMTLCAPLVNEFWKEYYARTQQQQQGSHNLNQHLLPTSEPQNFNSNLPPVDNQHVSQPVASQHLSSPVPLPLTPATHVSAPITNYRHFSEQQNKRGPSQIFLQPRFLSPNTMLNSRFQLVSNYPSTSLIGQGETNQDMVGMSEKETGDKKFVCYACQIEFPSKQDFRKHSIVHHTPQTFNCEECSKKFDKKTSLNRHMLSHTTLRPHVCEECGKGFKERSNLTKHQIIHTGARPHVCEVCNASFRQLGHLIKHRLVHKPEKPHKCEVCLKGFKRKEHLKEHMVVHSEQYPYECETCRKKFRFKTNLKVHMQQHNGRKDFVCSFCNKAFTGKANLVQHQLIHEKLFSFSCPICQKKFKRKGHLQRHTHIHKNQILSTCVFCDKQFCNKSLFKKHLLFHTGTKEVFPCPTCNKKLSTKACLEQHMKKHTENLPFSCNQCQKKFRLETSLAKHMSSHLTPSEFLCSKCEKCFKKKTNFEKHKQVCNGQKLVKKWKLDRIARKLTEAGQIAISTNGLPAHKRKGVPVKSVLESEASDDVSLHPTTSIAVSAKVDLQGEKITVPMLNESLYTTGTTFETLNLPYAVKASIETGDKL